MTARALHAPLGADPRRERWSEGPLTKAFEDAWAAWNGLPTRRVLGWTGAALAALEFFAGVRGETVLCPSNTFMATPLTAHRRAGARSSSSTATATTSACRSRTSSARCTGTSRRRRSSCTSAATSPSIRANRRALPQRGDRADRGLRPRPRRRVERPPAGHVRRRRHLVVRANEDDLHRRRRHARLEARGRDRVRARLPQLRQARTTQVHGPELPAERVHRRARDRAGRAARRDRRVEERGRAHAARSRSTRRACSCPTA